MISLKIHTVEFETKAASCEISDRTEFLGRIQEVMVDFQTHIVCFDADRLYGINHVRSAVIHAMRSFARGNPISNTVEMEALLYASGSRQTSIGASFGIHRGKNRLYIGCFPAHNEIWETLGSLVQVCECEDPWCNPDERKQADLMKLFDITEEELATTIDRNLEPLVLERVALLDVYR